ncbi:hypothetical protein R6258_11325 [Halomonas sp. HP20-15]|uniref:hypothetical protein n=1 Tax=Halomonas sp. HP20-15 TaxID=3085901 RepID=UPI002980F5C3|nr:hypothetical protein [Halomonas sp. HP20-15]MDW5377509.1 hypothetical protein [Halomonas sp. HP20-15]
MNDLNQANRPRLREPQPERAQFPDVYMPAMPPLGLIDALEKRLRIWLGNRKRRRAFRQRFLPLLAYDDAILDDMGHCRGDIQWAADLPLKEDAAAALSKRRAQRHRAR